MEPTTITMVVNVGCTVAAWLLGIWVGYVFGQGNTRREALAVAMRSQDEEKELTASERLAMIKVRQVILSKMEEKWR